MKTIPMPKSREERIDVIERYFYGSFPHFQEWDRDSKQYPAFHVLDGFTREQEPEPRIVIAEHVDGTRTWASRAVSSEGAHFAALDVDTTDAAALANLRECLDEVYGEGSYNWEQREGTGVHVWFLWDGVVTLNWGKALVQLLLERAIGCEIDRKYPTERVPLRLPFPGEYDPMPSFRDDELHILESDDLDRIIGERQDKKSSDSGPGVRRSVPTHPTQYKGPAPLNIIGSNNRETGPQEATVRGYTPEKLTYGKQSTLKQTVDDLLSTRPEDGGVYDLLITRHLMWNCIAVYGEETGLAALRNWICRGNRSKISERLNDLNRYYSNNVRKGYPLPITTPLVSQIDLSHFTTAMFDDQLRFLRRQDIRLKVSRCLFAMLVCEWRFRRSELSEWWISHRDLAVALGYDAENGRKCAERHLNWIVADRGATQLPVFIIAKEHNFVKANCYRLNPEYEFLLDRLPDLPVLPPGGD
jgi:hypothetical protein